MYLEDKEKASLKEKLCHPFYDSIFEYFDTSIFHSKYALYGLNSSIALKFCMFSLFASNSSWQPVVIF